MCAFGFVFCVLCTMRSKYVKEKNNFYGILETTFEIFYIEKIVTTKANTFL